MYLTKSSPWTSLQSMATARTRPFVRTFKCTPKSKPCTRRFASNNGFSPVSQVFRHFWGGKTRSKLVSARNAHQKFYAVCARSRRVLPCSANWSIKLEPIVVQTLTLKLLLRVIFVSCIVILGLSS